MNAAMLALIGGDTLDAAAARYGVIPADLINACRIHGLTPRDALDVTTPQLAALKTPMSPLPLLRALAAPRDDLAGVYFLFNSDELVYVGRSITSTTRIAVHWKTKEFTHTAFVPCTAAAAVVLEARYVWAYKPRYNLNAKGKPQGVLLEHQLTEELVPVRSMGTEQRKSYALELIAQGYPARDVCRMACIDPLAVTNLRKQYKMQQQKSEAKVRRRANTNTSKEPKG